MPINEFQKPFDEIGYKNAELITRRAYCTDEKVAKRCECNTCREARRKLKRQVNKLMGRKFHEDV